MAPGCEVVSAANEGTAIGYRKPPAATRFRKGRSGNPRGRPKNRKRGLPYDHVLGQMVTIRDGGAERRVTAAEAFLLHLTKKGLEGDGPAARASLAALSTARASQPSEKAIDILRVIISAVGPSLCLDTLGFGVKTNAADKDKVRWHLKSWVIDAALARLGDRRLTIEHQREVWNVAYWPSDLRWPEWWTYRG